MSRRPGNFDNNYPKVIKYLEDNELEYVEYAGGQHLKIFGPVAIIDLWPSRMTYHIIDSEGVQTTTYERLDFWFNKEQLTKVLEGERVWQNQ